MTARLLRSLVIATLVSTSPALAGEFPDDWYYYEKDRPAKLRYLETRPAPKLLARSWIGEPQDLAKLKGKIVVIDFWATWCGPCMAALPKNVALAKKYGKKGVVLMGIHDANRGHEKMAEVVKEQGITYPCAIDQGGASTRNFRVSFWPTYIVIDRQGIVRAAGLRPDRVDDVVERLLAEKPAAKKTGAGGKVGGG